MLCVRRIDQKSDIDCEPMDICIATMKREWGLLKHYFGLYIALKHWQQGLQESCPWTSLWMLRASRFGTPITKTGSCN